MGQTERVADTKMTKQEVQERVLQDGSPLALSKFMWDEDTQVFATTEADLTINFTGVGPYRFTTGSRCTFNTGPFCTFDTGNYCIFRTGRGCTFYTGAGCTFTTGGSCTFSTGPHCIWAVDHKIYPFGPLFIQGSRWPVNVYQPGYLRIGCEEHTFRQWGRCAGNISRVHNVSQKTLREYTGLIKVAREWAKQKGWLTPK